MPVSGLVITFTDRVSKFPAALECLRDAPTIEVGEGNGSKLAIVVDSDSPQHDQEIWHWVHELPGVALVEVAFVGFE